MSTYILRRLLLLIPTILIVTALTTFSTRLIPGDAVDILIGEIDAGGNEDRGEMRAAIEKQLGLDVPVYVQYVRWWKNIILHGDMGQSIFMSTNIRDQIIQRLPISIELGIMALIIALLISFPVAIYSAIRQDTIGDYAARSVAILFISVPSFWVGIMVVVFPSIWWGWSPPITNIPLSEANPYCLPTQ